MTPAQRAILDAAADMAACLTINRAYRAALEACGEKVTTLPLDEIFGPKDRKALAAYESAVNELLGARPLPMELSA